jgi:hypothetical protein
MLPVPHRALEIWARLGYAARGGVNLVVGVLALLSAFAHGGEATGSKGALQSLLQQPLGHGLLALAAAGLLGFAVWRVLQALCDADGRGDGAKALLARLGQLFSAVVHLGLAGFALDLALGAAGGGGDDDRATRDWTRWLLAQPGGRLLVVAAGLAVAGAAIAMLAKAWSASFLQRLSCPAGSEGWIRSLGRVGYVARGLVFLMVAGFLVIAAWRVDPSQAHGLGGALQALQEQPFGRLLFAVMAAGLAAFGAYGVVEARYRRIAVSGTVRLPGGARIRVT